MFIEPTSIDGLYTIDPERHADDPGADRQHHCGFNCLGNQFLTTRHDETNHDAKSLPSSALRSSPLT